MTTVAEALSALIERLRRRKTSYQLAFGSPAGKAVLRDLAPFCRAAETTFHPMHDARVQAMLEGRRQVWLRICQHLDFTPEELAALYRAAVLDPTGAEND